MTNRRKLNTRPRVAKTAIVNPVGSPVFKLAPLSRFDPFPLVRDKNDKAGALVVALAAAYNDLKSAVHIGHGLERTSVDRSKPNPDGAQTAGFYLQLTRLLAGIVREVLVLLDDNRALFEKGEIADFLPKLNPRPAAMINKLLRAATETVGTQEGVDSDVKLLVRIRGGLAFHYSTKEIAVGYLKHFSPGASEATRSNAFVSDGSTLQGTRFYFADAAMESALNALSANAESTTIERVMKLVNDVNAGLNAIVRAFIIERCGRPAPYREAPPGD